MIARYVFILALLTSVAAAVGDERADVDVAQLYDRVLELEQDRENRLLIERARIQEQADRSVDVTDEQWTHRVGGRIQTDFVNWADDDDFGGQPNYVEFRRLRLFLSGEGYGVYEYRLKFEFTPEVQRDAPVVGGRVDLSGFNLEVKDAFLAIRDVPALGYVRLGQFKSPFGLSKLINSRNSTFLERALPITFVPGRQLGIAAYNHSTEENATWALGTFFDNLDEKVHSIEDDNQGIRLMSRLTWTPYYDELAEGRFLFHTGLGYVYTYDRDDEVRFRSRPEIHRGDFLIDTGDLDAEDYHVLGGELAWVHGPLSVQSEAICASVNRTNGDETRLFGAYVFVSYFLTGEHRPYNRTRGIFGRVVPLENFWIVNTPGGRCAGWGAWELAARWSHLDFDDIGGQRLDDFTAGANWYWNPHARVMFNWIHPIAQDAVAGCGQGDVLSLRLHVDF